MFLFLNTAMAPAIPVIAQDFQISEALSSWVMTAYMVSGAVMTVIMGRLSDLLGAKKMLMIMMACFTVGTILAPFANDISTLIAIRALQGIAMATLISNPPVHITQMTLQLYLNSNKKKSFQPIIV